MEIVVGTVVEKDGKYLLVQEAKEQFFGLWNLPAGCLDVGETVFEGAKRETKEEAGVDVELTGICQVGNLLWLDNSTLTVIFVAKLLGGDICAGEGEILAVKWFTYEEILAMREKLRNVDFMLKAIENARAGSVAPLNLVAIGYHNEKLSKS